MPATFAFFTDMFPNMWLFFGRLLVLVACLPIHEFAHGYIADKLGDPTPRRDGRLTLNPFAHLDLWGSVCLVLCGFGWAKPVVVNPFNLRNRKGNMALVALAGPVSNLLMCLLFVGLTKVVTLFTVTAVTSILGIVFLTIAQVNLSLAIFNLLPVPPLDGSKILYFFLPNRASYWLQEREHIISLVFMSLILLDNFGVLAYGIGDVLYLVISPIWNGICILFGL